MKKLIKTCDFCREIMDSSNENNPWFLHKLKRYKVTLEEQTNIGIQITYDICATCSKKMLSAMVKPYDNDIAWHKYPQDIPEKIGLYLITVGGGIVTSAWFEPAGDFHDHCWKENLSDDHECDKNYILAWREMPEPYIKEEKEL